MKILIDESLPGNLKRALADYDATTVPEIGWSGATNDELLRLAARRFDVFITLDQGLDYEETLRGTPMAVIILAVLSDRLDDLLPLAPQIRETLDTIQPGAVVRLAI